MQLRFSLISLFGAFAALLLWPTLASAQIYLCDGGSVGSESCPVDEGPVYAPKYTPAQPPRESFAALVWHPNAADVWAEGNYRYQSGWERAERDALDACHKVMGDGCKGAGQWANSSVTIIRDQHGSFHLGWRNANDAHFKKSLDDCSAKQFLPCEVFAKIKSSTGSRSPGASARKYFAASAWVKGDVGYNGKLYVASGYRSADDAKAAAIKACGDATSRPCEANALSGNGFIQAYGFDSKSSAISENSSKRAKEAAQVSCKEFKAKSCILQAQFDSRKSGLFVHDFVASKSP